MLNNGETELGSWPIKYFPPQGGKYSGKLVLTNKRLLFTNKKLKQNSTPIQLNKSEISSVSVKNKLLRRSIIISVEGKKHAFSKFLFNPKRLIQMIKI